MSKEKSPTDAARELKEAQDLIQERLRRGESGAGKRMLVSPFPKEEHPKVAAAIAAGIKEYTYDDVTDDSVVSRGRSFRSDVPETSRRSSTVKVDKTTLLAVQALIKDLMLSSEGLGNAFGLQVHFSQVVPSSISGKWSVSLTVENRPKTVVLSLPAPEDKPVLVDESHYIKKSSIKKRLPVWRPKTKR
jgi:hypothetical protein